MPFRAVSPPWASLAAVFVLLFGQALPVLGAVMSGDAGSWIQLPPPARTEHASLWDAPRDRLLIVGGHLDEPLATVWEFPGMGPTTWRQVVTGSGGPGSIASHRAFHDTIRDRMLVVVAGGYEVWALALTTGNWSLLAPQGDPPSVRRDAAVIHDPVRNRILVFGGDALCIRGDCTVNDLWQLSLTDPPVWEELHPAGVLPAPRGGSATIYDPIRDRMLIFGGSNRDGAFNDVWALALAGPPAWTRLVPSGTPPSPRSLARAEYDPVGDRLVVLGGSPGPGNDLWALSLDGAATWQSLPTSGPGPVTAARSSFSYDGGRQRFLLHGANGGAETWALVLAPAPQWSILGAPLPARTLPSLIVDAAADRLVLYGGLIGEPFESDTWTYPLTGGSGWSRLGTQGTAPARAGHTATLDPVTRRMIVFGNGTPVGNDETWSLALEGVPTWSQIVTPTRPPGRYFHGAAYDPRGRRLLMFGGLNSTNEVWSLALDGIPNWTELQPNGPRVPRKSGATVVYDSRRNRLLVCGGNDSTGTSDETWEFALEPTSAWTRLAAIGSPGGLFWHSAAYDSATDRMLVLDASHGGALWELAFSGVPTWTRLLPAGRGPGARIFQVWVMDEERRQLILGGGSTPGSNDPPFNDLLALRFDTPTPLALSVDEAVVEGQVVRIAWSAPRGTIAAAVVERRIGDEPWAPRATVVADAAGRFLFEDRGLLPGMRHGYRLDVGGSSGGIQAGEVWLDVPAIPLHSLALATRNPVVGAIAASLSLPTPGSVTLELFDIAGRKIFTRRIDDLPAGVHQVNLDEARTGRAGMYVLRLQHEGRAVSTKVVLFGR